MIAKHTPGPWLHEHAPGYCGEIIAPNGKTVCSFYDEPTDEDAYLIAAAPELLDFVNEYIEAWSEGMAGDSYLMRIAEKLRAKATGEGQ